MYLNDIFGAYKLLRSSREFLQECMRNKITFDDLRAERYPDVAERFRSLEEQGHTYFRKGRIVVWPAALAYTATHFRTISETQRYAEREFYPVFPQTQS